LGRPGRSGGRSPILNYIKKWQTFFASFKDEVAPAWAEAAHFFREYAPRSQSWSGTCVAPWRHYSLKTSNGENRRRLRVAPAKRSTSALDKALIKRTPDHLPVQGLGDLLKDLATIARNRVQPTRKSVPPFDIVTHPTPLQRHALQLPGLHSESPT
jgi:hypothetical protein